MCGVPMMRVRVCVWACVCVAYYGWQVSLLVALLLDSSDESSSMGVGSGRRKPRSRYVARGVKLCVSKWSMGSRVRRRMRMVWAGKT
jgi:hypothetical protein